MGFSIRGWGVWSNSLNRQQGMNSIVVLILPKRIRLRPRSDDCRYIWKDCFSLFNIVFSSINTPARRSSVIYTLASQRDELALYRLVQWRLSHWLVFIHRSYQAEEKMIHACGSLQVFLFSVQVLLTSIADSFNGELWCWRCNDLHLCCHMLVFFWCCLHVGNANLDTLDRTGRSRSSTHPVLYSNSPESDEYERNLRWAEYTYFSFGSSLNPF